MLHLMITMMFLGFGMFALAVIAAMLVDEAPAIARALRLRPATVAVRPGARRVRVIRSPLLAPMSPARLRAAA